MRTRSVFSLLAIVVFGVVGWVGPAGASAVFTVDAEATLTITGDLGFVTPTVTGDTSSNVAYSPTGASASTSQSASPPTLAVSAFALGVAGAPSSFATADATAWIDWSVVNSLPNGPALNGPPLPPLFVSFSVGETFPTFLFQALADAAGDFASLLAEVTLTGEYVMGEMFPGVGGPISYSLSFSLVSGGSLTQTGPTGTPALPSLLIESGGSLMLHLEVHVEGVARAAAVAPAPVPATLVLLGSGLAALGTLAWRRRR